MCQRFRLKSLDSYSPVNTGVAREFGEFFFEVAQYPALVHALWQPTKRDPRVEARPFCEVKREDGTCPKWSPANRARHGLGKCPDEIIGLVFGYLKDFGDVVCFVVTCQRYYEIGRPHLAACVEETIITSWAGDRLICLGYTTMDDMPRGVLTDREAAFFNKQLELRRKLDPAMYRKACEESTNDGDNWFEVDASTGLRAEYDSASVGIDDVPKLGPDAELKYRKVQFLARYGRGNPEPWSYCYKTLEKRCRERRRYISPEEISELSMILFSYYANDGLVCIYGGLEDDLLYGGKYVLRNLTTREYVRGNAIRELWTIQGKPYLEAVRFEHALVVRITWNEDSDLSIRYEGPLELHRGVWAGHRFDVCHISTVENEQGPIDNWKDVTNDVLEEVVAVFDGEQRT